MATPTKKKTRSRKRVQLRHPQLRNAPFTIPPAAQRLMENLYSTLDRTKFNPEALRLLDQQIQQGDSVRSNAIPRFSDIARFIAGRLNPGPPSPTASREVMEKIRANLLLTTSPPVHDLMELGNRIATQLRQNRNRSGSKPMPRISARTTRGGSTGAPSTRMGNVGRTQPLKGRRRASPKRGGNFTVMRRNGGTSSPPTRAPVREGASSSVRKPKPKKPRTSRASSTVRQYRASRNLRLR